MKTRKFEIVLEDFNLSDSQSATLEKELHAVVAKHLVNNAIAGNLVGQKLIKNPEWIGIWLKHFKDIGRLKLAKTFNQQKIF